MKNSFIQPLADKSFGNHNFFLDFWSSLKPQKVDFCLYIWNDGYQNRVKMVLIYKKKIGNYSESKILILKWSNFKIIPGLRGSKLLLCCQH